MYTTGSLEPALDAGFEDLDLGLSAFASTWLFVISTAPLPLAFSGDSFLFLACTPFGLKVLFLFPFVEAFPVTARTNDRSVSQTGLRNNYHCGRRTEQCWKEVNHSFGCRKLGNSNEKGSVSDNRKEVIVFNCRRRLQDSDSNKQPVCIV